ncbi:MAG: hypothetical protein J7K36_01965 [Archaeoglobaceae archaeon]|nr:hypothetical protein [Archaeoglobaceae archaeon]
MNDLWTSARSLWVKFCGIADEYKMLRDRWLYLHSENKLPVLPYLRKTNLDEDEKTFDLLDKHVEKLEKLFGELGFERSKMESYNDFKQKTSGVDRVDIIDKLRLVEDYVYDLANFVGLLKFAFFQRTVSSEIPHVASGIPHSPERTIGNELFYLAADNVARRYYECLNIPYGKWDGFITFTPPITEGSFYGGFYKPSDYIELFHISMSEEAKYFVGSYFTLAHEFGHAVTPRRIVRGDNSVIDEAYWVKSLFNNILSNTIELLNEQRTYHCERCPVYIYLIKGKVSELFSDLLADIVTVYIAGENYLHEFIDFGYSMLAYEKYDVHPFLSQVPFLIRTICCYYYFRMAGLYNFKNRIKRIIQNADEIRSAYGVSCPPSTDFRECIAKICASWSKNIHDFNIRFWDTIFEDFGDDLSEFVYRYNPFWSSFDPEKLLKENLKQILKIVLPEEHLEELISIISKRGELKLFSMIIRDEFRINRKKKKL